MKSTLMKKTLTALALGSLSLLATGAHADWNRGGHEYGYGNHHDHAYEQSNMFGQQINMRQNHQMERIHAGMRSGQLTRAEFRELMNEQQQIRAMERHFRADGIIDMREFRRLDQALDMAGRNIREEKHDRQERHAYSHYPRFY